MVLIDFHLDKTTPCICSEKYILYDVNEYMHLNSTKLN